jgi:hypothetical protein
MSPALEARCDRDLTALKPHDSKLANAGVIGEDFAHREHLWTLNEDVVLDPSLLRSRSDHIRSANGIRVEGFLLRPKPILVGLVLQIARNVDLLDESRQQRLMRLGE